MKDTLGRENRKLLNKICPECGASFRPLGARSKYCSKPCMYKNNGKNQRGKKECWWKNQKGYIEGRLWLDDGTQVRVKQHRFVMEGIINRPLKISEDVHHINGIKSDNRPENLEIRDHGAHSTQTNINRVYKKGYKLQLTDADRKRRSLRAIATGLSEYGRAAIAKSKGE